MGVFYLRHPTIWRGGCLVIASLSYAIGYNMFLDPNQIAAGGLAGIATVLTRLIPIRTSLLLLIMNVPLVILAFIFMGWNFTKNSIGGFLIYTVMVELTGPLPCLTHNLVLATVFGGAFYGVGMALMTMGNGSIGGTELVNRVLASKFPTVGLDGFCPMVDGSIVLFSMIMFRDVEVGLCAILTIVICSKLVNGLVKRVIWGHRHGDLCMIITSHPAEEIADLLMDRLGIAVTKLDGTGMYTGAAQSILLATVTEADTPRMREVLIGVDAGSFVMVIPVAELMGGKLIR